MISEPDWPCVCGQGESCQVPPPLAPLHAPCGPPPPPPGVSVGVAGRSVGVAVGPGGGVWESGMLPAWMVETVYGGMVIVGKVACACTLAAPVFVLPRPPEFPPPAPANAEFVTVARMPVQLHISTMRSRPQTPDTAARYCAFVSQRCWKR